MIERRGRLSGFEIERTTAPRVTESMKKAKELLDLAELSIVHAGRSTFALGAGMKAIVASRVLEDL